MEPMKLGNNNRTDGYWQWPAALAERIPLGWLERAGWVVASSSDAADPIAVLDAYTQRLVANDLRPARYVHPAAPDEDEIVALSHLAERVAYTVRPAHPSPRFRKELQRALLSTHRQKAAQRRIFAHPLFEQGVVDRSLLERMEINSPWFWQVAAAVPILLAIAAIIWRYTHRGEDQAGKLVV